MSRNDDEKKDYNLYTEQIVKESDRRSESKKRIRLFIIIIIIIGAALFCIFALPGIIRRANQMINAGYSEITLNSGEAPSDEEINMLVENSGNNSGGTVSYEEALSSMQERVADIRKSVVTVTTRNNSITEVFNDDKGVEARPGIVIGKTKTRLVILTFSKTVDEEKPVVIKVDDTKRIQGTYLSENEATGLALVSVKISDFEQQGIQMPEVVAIGTSDNVLQGASVIAFGDLKGNKDSVDFGIVSGTGDADIPDFVYKRINTSVSGGDDYGFLFNSRGSFLGVSAPNDSSDTFSALGIDSLKKLIETMSNGKKIPYAGIIGKDITDELSDEYNLPKGVYVNSVAMDSPAFKAGIQAGDIITAVQSEEILSLDNFSDKLYNYASGQTVKMEIRRQGNNEYRKINFNVTLSDGRKQ